MSEANRLPPAERYRRDATFRSLVDTMTAMIANCDYTPTELREAAILAAIRYEQIHAHPKFAMGRDGSFERIDSYHGRKDI